MQTDETENQRGLCGLGCHRAAGILTAFGTDGFKGSGGEFRGHNVLEICDAAVEDIAELCERGVVGLKPDVRSTVSIVVRSTLIRFGVYGRLISE
jgi:hypothetical protein